MPNFLGLNIIVTGIILGLIFWTIVIPLNAAQGKVILPWEAGIGTIISSILAFIVYGIIATFTIKHYGYENKGAKDPQTT